MFLHPENELSVKVYGKKSEKKHNIDINKENV